MTNGYLSQYFESVAAKKLTGVEVDPAKSNQHEFNGSRELKEVLGIEQPRKFETKFLWMDDQNVALSENGTVTWYDARDNHPSRSEFRLYFPTNSVIKMAGVDDTLFIARRTDSSLLLIITLSGSTIEQQLYWLFGLTAPTESAFKISDFKFSGGKELDFAATYILGELDIEVKENETDKLDKLVSEFNGIFPTTNVFSKFARKTLELDFDLVEDPDDALIEYMNWEEKLFRRLEHQVVSFRLEKGFESSVGQDVDAFISFSLSVQNRRKSRAGYAFEDHLSHILSFNNISFTRKAVTENKSKPDFLFPGIIHYKNPEFSSSCLTMLGAKTTCKDRWRQILPEASRIKEKHLLTLEPGISESQTSEMQAHYVQLVVPESLHRTYSDNQQTWLMSVKEFMKMIKHRENMIIQ